MSQRDSLFRLIHSLSRNEKGYFKKYHKGYGGKDETDLIRLFDAVEKLKKYDEGKVRQALAGSAVLKHLSVSKNQLYHSILESLRSFHKGSTPEVRIRDLIRDGELLMSKALYNESREIFQKAKALSIQFERYPLLLEIYGYLFRINIVTRKDVNDFNEFAIGEHEKQMKALQQHEKVVRLRTIVSKMYFIGGSDTVIDNESRKEMVKLLDELLELKKDPELPYGAMAHLFSAMTSIYSFYLGDLESGLEVNRQYLNYLMEQEEMTEAVGSSNLVACLNNYMSDLLRIGKFEEYHKAMKRLQSMPVPNEQTRIRILEVEAISQTIFFTKTMRISEGVAYVKQILPVIEEYQTRFNQSFLLAIYDNFSILYLLHGDLSNALLYSNRILQYKVNVRTDIRIFHAVFNLAIHYEMKNFDFLEYAIKSTERTLRSRENTFRYPVIVLDFFRKASRFTTRQDEVNAFLELRSRLEEVFSDPHEYTANEYFNFSEWALCKAENKVYGTFLKGLVER